MKTLLILLVVVGIADAIWEKPTASREYRANQVPRAEGKKRMYDDNYGNNYDYNYRDNYDYNYRDNYGNNYDNNYGNSDCYNDGYLYGYNEGYNSGRDEGFFGGHLDGYEKGYYNGYYNGPSRDYNGYDGYENGYYNGYYNGPSRDYNGYNQYDNNDRGSGDYGSEYWDSGYYNATDNYPWTNEYTDYEQADTTDPIIVDREASAIQADQKNKIEAATDDDDRWTKVGRDVSPIFREAIRRQKETK